MSRKAQLLAGFLVLATALAAWQLLGLIRFPSTLLQGSAVKQGDFLAEPDNDTDGDGLTDQGESYWNTDFQDDDTDDDGYKDGEEAASGHDPLIPGPDDLLITDNATQQLNELIVAGLYEGSLKPDDPNFSTSLDQIADAVAVMTDDTTPRHYTLVIVPMTPENIKQYRTHILSNLKLLTAAITPEQDTGSFESVFRRPILRIRAIAETLASIAVPKEYQSSHTQFLTALDDLADQYQAFIGSDDDTVRQTVIIGQIAHILDERLPSILERYRTLLQSTP